MTDRTPLDSSVFKQFERDGFDRVAKRYDQAIAKVTAQINLKKEYTLMSAQEDPVAITWTTQGTHKGEIKLLNLFLLFSI